MENNPCLYYSQEELTARIPQCLYARHCASAAAVVIAKACQAEINVVMWTGLFCVCLCTLRGKRPAFPFPHSPNTLTSGLEWF